MFLNIQQNLGYLPAFEVTRLLNIQRCSYSSDNKFLIILDQTILISFNTQDLLNYQSVIFGYINKAKFDTQ